MLSDLGVDDACVSETYILFQCRSQYASLYSHFISTAVTFFALHSRLIMYAKHHEGNPLKVEPQQNSTPSPQGAILTIASPCKHCNDAKMGRRQDVPSPVGTSEERTTEHEWSEGGVALLQAFEGAAMHHHSCTTTTTTRKGTTCHHTRRDVSDD